MGAREQMIEWFGDSVSDATAQRVADAILNDHTRELAKKIRAYRGALNGCEWPEVAADLIDPNCN